MYDYVHIRQERAYDPSVDCVADLILVLKAGTDKPANLVAEQVMTGMKTVMVMLLLQSVLLFLLQTLFS